MEIRIGRYGIVFHRRIWWFQTRVPTQIWTFGFISFFREARPQDIDKNQQFPLNERMKWEGRAYHYWKAGEDIRVGGEIRFIPRH